MYGLDLILKFPSSSMNIMNLRWSDIDKISYMAADKSREVGVFLELNSRSPCYSSAGTGLALLIFIISETLC